MEFSRTDPKSSDSLFTQSSTLVCYGMLADTSRFYTLIFYAPAATLIPVITTFDKTGERIYDQGVDFGCWDGGPYSYECDGQIKIDSKMNLNLEHVTTCFDCDSTSSKPVKYFEKRKGKIRNDGMIELEAIKR
ncbi:MAG TPA: hypothetical protein DGG95_16925 [Cytophagales bacterium]|nr:hypothetical protein [Cytophagales bacterium]